MPEYIYRAMTKDGLMVKNRVDSPSKQTLIKQLKRGELTPIDITQVSYGGKKRNVPKKNTENVDEMMQFANSAVVAQRDSQRKKTVKEQVNLALAKQEKITTRDLMVFTQNFYLLKKADFNNIHALNTIIGSTENVTLKGILEDVLAGVEAGDYMYKTMEYYSDVFPYIYTNMIKVGELSGSLTESLQQAVKYLDSNSDTMRKLRSIIIPNLIQLVALIALMFVGSLYTVPTIQNVYDQVGTTDKIPAITLAFAAVMQWIAAHWYIIVGIIVAIIGVIVWYVHTPKGRYNYDYFKYTMPIFGKLFYTLDFSRFLRSMLLNLQNGMRIQDAMDVSKNIIDNYVMRAMIETSMNNLLIGQSWIEPFEKSGLSSTMITEMLKVGMQTDLSEMMEKLLEYMDIDINNIMAKIMAVLPQVVYSIVGVMIIFVVIVVLVPCIQVYMGNFLFSAAGL